MVGVQQKYENDRWVHDKVSLLKFIVNGCIKRFQHWEGTMTITKILFMFLEYFNTIKSGALKFSVNLGFNTWFFLSFFFLLTKTHNSHHLRDILAVWKSPLATVNITSYNYLLPSSWIMVTTGNVVRDMIE